MSTHKDRRLDRRQDAYEQRINELLAASDQGLAAMREEAERIIATSRKSIQPRLRQTLEECQADYDDEREFGWAHPLDVEHKGE